MSDLGGLTVRHRRLAAELRRLRDRAGLTGEQVASELGWSVSKVSRLEHGRISFKSEEVESLLTLYDVPPEQRAELLSLARETRRKSWLETESASLPSRFATHVSMEAEARIIWNWEPYVVPGLLQTEDYARSIFEAWRTVVTMSPAEIQRRVDIRLARQERLTRDPPLTLCAVLDESVLTRQISDAGVMRGQLEHLLAYAQEPGIEVRVLALDADHPVFTGPFAYMRFTDAKDESFDDVVSVENLTRNYYIEDEEDTYQYRLTFERLVAESRSARQSQEMIQKHIQELWT
jgi:transcriptional regulator with XRE-family HTH domain